MSDRINIPNLDPYPCFTVRFGGWEPGMETPEGELCSSAYVSKPDNVIHPSDKDSGGCEFVLVCVRTDRSLPVKMGVEPRQELIARKDTEDERVAYFIMKQGALILHTIDAHTSVATLTGLGFVVERESRVYPPSAVAGGISASTVIPFVALSWNNQTGQYDVSDPSLP